MTESMLSVPRFVSVIPSGAGYIGQVVRALVAAGWNLDMVPARGHLSRNRQLIVLRTLNRTVPLRVFAYKVTQSSRGRGHERRVEITSTYGGGLAPAQGFSDVVLGYDTGAKVFVGLDPERLHHGGETSNASSFLEPRGLVRSDEAPFIIMLRQTRIFPEGESQAFFRPEHVGEYLLNYSAIHAGVYNMKGLGVGPPLTQGWEERDIGTVDRAMAQGKVLVLTRGIEIPIRTARLSDEALREVVRGARTRRPSSLTPEELRAIQQRQEENGFLGEQFVFEFEKESLSRAGRADLSARVDWISRRDVGEGYDISSFDPSTGAQRYIEVKSSEGSGRIFDISASEWIRAKELGEQYWIYRVIKVRSSPTIDAMLRDPVRLVSEGFLEMSPSGWRIKIITVP